MFKLNICFELVVILRMTSKNSKIPKLAEQANEDTKTSIGTSNSVHLDWQSNVCSVNDRNSAMVNNPLMSDVIFEVGNPGNSQRIHAHKYVLGSASPVFYAMLYGEMAESKVEVTDVEPSIFLSVLKYLYCDEISLEPQTVFPTLYVSNKYNLPHLLNACVKYLHSTLAHTNVCVVLQHSLLFEESKLINHCWDVIDAQAELVLSSEGIKQLDEDKFISILERDTLTCKEKSIFSAAMSWAEEECKRRDIEPIPGNKKNVLGRALQLIRFPTMSLQEYANGPAQSGILDKDQIIDIFLYMTSDKKPTLDFPTKPRTGLKMIECYRSCTNRSHVASCFEASRSVCYDSIEFSVDKRIFLVGYRLLGANQPSNFSVILKLKRMGEDILQSTTSYSSDGSRKFFKVFFEYPIQIEPSISYCAIVSFDGGLSRYYGTGGKSEVVAEGVTFKFISVFRMSDGIKVYGEIPALLYYAPNNDNTMI